MKRTKKLNLIILISCFCLSTSAQNPSYKKQPSLTLNFFLNDYITPELINQTSLRHVIKNKQFSSLSAMQAGIALGYFKGLNNTVDFSATAAGSFASYGTRAVSLQAGNKLLIETDGNLLLKLLKDKRIIRPFLSAGLGTSFYSKDFGISIPLGAGIQFGLGKGSFINSQFLYKVALTKFTADHFTFSLGFGGLIKTRKKSQKKSQPQTPRVTVTKDKDLDGDGIVDRLDKCPEIFGLLSNDGCPDRDKDKDGINDQNDNCPTTPGVAKYKGCPIPDADSDGLNDEEDNCPFTPGLTKYKGCPVPDSDADGLDDERDSCITIAGPLINNGCPEQQPASELRERVKNAATQIFFETGSAKLLSKSFEPLNDVAKILLNNPTLKLDIEGHTDSVGNNISNLILSKKRAESVLIYLQSKGVDEKRLTSKGFGETQPLTENKTSEGRAKNRRVELIII